MLINDRSRRIMVYPGSHYEKDRQNTYAADYGCCDIKKPLDYLVRFPCQIIFDMEHHDFGIEKDSASMLDIGTPTRFGMTPTSFTKNWAR